MSVRRSGMNILIELTEAMLLRVIESLLTVKLPLLKPDENYTRFDLISGTWSTTAWSETPRIGEPIPDFIVGHRIRFIYERTDGTEFRYGWEEGERLGLYFAALPEVRSNGVRLRLNYRGVGTGFEEIAEDLGPDIDLLRGQLTRIDMNLSFDIPFWGRPEPFPTPPLLEAYITRPAGGILMIGLAVEGGTETFPYTFMTHEEPPGDRQTQTLVGVYGDDIGLAHMDHKMLIAIEGELMDDLTRRLFEEEVLAQLASTGVFHGDIGYFSLMPCEERREEFHLRRHARTYIIDCDGELHADIGEWHSVWDDANIRYRLWFSALEWVTRCESVIVEDAEFIDYFDGERGSRTPWYEEHFYRAGSIGDNEFALVREAARANRGDYWCTQDTPPESSVVEYNGGFTDFGDPEIVVITDVPISIDYAIHHAKPGCKAITTEEGNSEVWITIQNTGAGPLKLLVMAEAAEVFSVYTENDILLPEEETGVRISLRSYASGRRSGILRILHNATNESNIEIPIEATVTHTFEDLNQFVSDDFKTVICSWADVVHIARGFPWWRSFFEELPFDIDDPYPCLEVFDLELKDPQDSYRFVVRAESGELLAEANHHSTYKRLYLPVDRNATISLAAQLRDQPETKAQDPVFLQMRKQTAQTINGIDLDGAKTVTVLNGGVCLMTEAGLTVIDTIDPWRPLVMARLEELGPVSAISSYRNRVIAIGEKGMFLIDASDLNKPKQLDMVEDMAGAHAVAYYRNQVWVVRQSQVCVFEISMEHKLKLLTENQFKATPHDFVLCRRHGVVLDKSGLLIFELRGAELSLVASQPVDNAQGLSLHTHGAMLCLSNAEIGTQMLDISEPTSLETVARYEQPFWTFGLSMDFSRNLAYKLNAKGSGIDILRIHKNKVIKT